MDYQPVSENSILDEEGNLRVNKLHTGSLCQRFDREANVIILEWTSDDPTEASIRETHPLVEQSDDRGSSWRLFNDCLARTKGLRAALCTPLLFVPE